MINKTGQEYEQHGKIKNNLSDCFIGFQSTYRNSILDVAMGPASILQDHDSLYSDAYAYFHSGMPSRESRIHVLKFPRRTLTNIEQM